LKPQFCPITHTKYYADRTGISTHLSVDGAAAQYDRAVEISVVAASHLSSAALTGDSKSTNWGAGNSNWGGGGDTTIQEPE